MIQKGIGRLSTVNTIRHKMGFALIFGRRTVFPLQYINVAFMLQAGEITACIHLMTTFYIPASTSLRQVC